MLESLEILVGVVKWSTRVPGPAFVSYRSGSERKLADWQFLSTFVLVHK